MKQPGQWAVVWYCRWRKQGYSEVWWWLLVVGTTVVLGAVVRVDLIRILTHLLWAGAYREYKTLGDWTDGKIVSDTVCHGGSGTGSTWG